MFASLRATSAERAMPSLQRLPLLDGNKEANTIEEETEQGSAQLTPLEGSV